MDVGLVVMRYVFRKTIIQWISGPSRKNQCFIEVFGRLGHDAIMNYLVIEAAHNQYH